MNIPEDLKYSRTHEWVRIENDEIAVVGITDHAQEQLGDVVYLGFEDEEGLTIEEGTEIVKGRQFGVVESSKTLAELYAPVGGEVVEVNHTLTNNLETINDDPYEDGWMVKIRVSDPGDLDDLMNAAEYKQFLEEEAH
ncbi:MAG: glycine cleavage system protein GcvH [Deltaproteobacteria bacterium]|nr:glycine cleavage system protein GcvH [Deltaproteobacteria bacterium]